MSGSATAAQQPKAKRELPRYRTAARLLPDEELQAGETNGGVDIYLVFVNPL